MLFNSTLPLRFWRKVRVLENGCWEWTAYLDKNGYGQFSIGPKTVRAYRWAYECLIGPIPEGLTIDHLCRFPACVNPAHLEPVTPKENYLRGYGLPALNARKTHCDNGHPFDEVNTYIYKGYQRHCRACNREFVRQYTARKKGEKTK